jgi:DNA-directed RNA polymerase specialized sigma24 family protein
MSIRKKDWIMDQAALERLLAQFDADPERAAEKFEVMRSGLIRILECWGGTSPPDLADIVVNRVARRLMEGEVIRPDALNAYFRSVARNVWREDRRSPEAQFAPLDDLPPHQQPAVDPHAAMLAHRAQLMLEQRLNCLEECVAALPPETRGLILEYYEGEESARIENRKRLAEMLEIPLSRLRLRIHRIREKLERCVEDCLARAGG